MEVGDKVTIKAGAFLGTTSTDFETSEHDIEGIITGIESFPDGDGYLFYIDAEDGRQIIATEADLIQR